jgi:hypothetical protein
MIRHLAFALVLVAAGSAQAAEKKLDRTFTVSPGGTLTVDADGSEVRVKGGDGNQVVVHILLRGTEDNLSNTTVDAAQKADGVLVTVRRPKRGWLSWGNWSSDELIEVTVPRRYVVNVRTGGGGIELRDTVGAASLNTSGGEITASNIEGKVDARTSGGSIHVESVRGDVTANTSGGEIELLKIDGKIVGDTSGGSVRVSLVGANRGISASSSGGEIRVIVPRGTTGNVDLSTSGGGVDSEIQVQTSVRKDSKLVGTINGGGEAIYAHTSGGSVSLREGS